mmetsp:Transcript_7919/g.16548  ORF Transcript_7919/g.16548 Transcript_7919/m.16548 type:complete len:228 (-) Transcript_7919:2144-2827(-)
MKSPTIAVSLCLLAGLLKSLREGDPDGLLLVLAVGELPCPFSISSRAISKPDSATPAFWYLRSSSQSDSEMDPKELILLIRLRSWWRRLRLLLRVFDWTMGCSCGSSSGNAAAKAFIVSSSSILISSSYISLLDIHVLFALTSSCCFFASCCLVSLLLRIKKTVAKMQHTKAVATTARIMTMSFELSESVVGTPAPRPSTLVPPPFASSSSSSPPWLPPSSSSSSSP